MQSLTHRIAEELNVRDAQVEAAVRLLDDGSTVPFIARYRKEATDGLDDTQLRTLEERLGYLRQLDERRTAIIASITEQGKLTPELEAALVEADTKTRLEDLYLPYKPKRRTKAQMAREAGLEPLAQRVLDDPGLDPESEAAAFISEEKGVADTKAALDGARHILVERFGEDAGLLARLRERMTAEARVFSRVVEDKKANGAKFTDYFDFSEAWKQVPSHRALALFRGRNQGVLSLRIDLDVPEGTAHPLEAVIAATFGVHDEGRPADAWLGEVVRLTWKLKIGPHIETDLMASLRERAEDEAIKVFARNLHDLLLAAPAGQRAVIGLDPGLRTGVKVAVVDATGKLLETATIHPHAPRNDWDGSLAVLEALVSRHAVELIAIGNGTASRETDKLAVELIKRHPESKLTKVVVSEAGASVYSASEYAAKEFPDIDVSLRGAASIARRLQDPLAELVKIEPKAIGVGQYQHDVAGAKLARSLTTVVEDCVNAVGVDLNTASVPLLTRVSGLNETVARNIVEHRDTNGAFRSRAQLLDVQRMGPKTYEQAAGFLRIRDGENPLDCSAVHPEAYPVVERILTATGRDLTGLIGDAAFLRSLDPADYTDETFGIPTIADILRELEKPGRDPRPEFRTATFKDGVSELKDIEPGMVLEGAVTNVTAFGAFVDVGVHQDGLVHISQLSHAFVKDPHAVVKAGDIVTVKVLEVDLQRRRVALTMKLGEPPAAPAARPARPQGEAGVERKVAPQSDRQRSPRPPRREKDAAGEGGGNGQAERSRRGHGGGHPAASQPNGGQGRSGESEGASSRPQRERPSPMPRKPEPEPSGALAEAFARALAAKKR